jgi:hypothetical protein
VATGVQRPVLPTIHLDEERHPSHRSRFQTSAKPSWPSSFSALLERVPGAGRVGVRWRGLTEHSTQIAEVGLRRRPLAGRNAALFRGELGGCHPCVKPRVPMPARIAAARSSRSGRHEADIVQTCTTYRPTAHPCGVASVRGSLLPELPQRHNPSPRGPLAWPRSTGILSLRFQGGRS